MTKCGFVAVVGAPNAGKSTLINDLVGSKVTIVSPKVQTTRNRILGVALKAETQIILVDTPGIFSTPKRRLEKAMIHSAWESLLDADGIMVIMDVSRKSFEDTELILERIEKQTISTNRNCRHPEPCPRESGDCSGSHKMLKQVQHDNRGVERENQQKIVLVLNKIDLISQNNLLALAQHFSKPFIDQIFMISALKGDGTQDIKDYWETRLPEGPWLFPENQLSDLSERLLAAEITREEIFFRLHDELPYAVWVETENWEEFKNGSVKITQVIYVQRESQRAIVLGHGGSQIKAIGASARRQLTTILARPVHLFLQVKVKANWMDNPCLYASVGLDFKSGED